LTPTAQVYRRFLERGILLDDSELQALMAGRDAGIAALDRTLTLSGPLIGATTRRQIATELADALFSYGLRAHLAREAPTALELNDQRAERATQLFTQKGGEVGMAERLLGLVPVGVSLTIHF